jgi:hypothetical protein
MGTFFSAMGSEFLARRQRLHEGFGDRNGTLVEFCLFAGIVGGCLAAVLGHVLGLAPLAVVLLGYVALEAPRQRAQARGEPEERVRNRYDRLAFMLFAVAAALGAAFLIIALQPPPPHFLPPPPGKPLDVDVASPS